MPGPLDATYSRPPAPFIHFPTTAPRRTTAIEPGERGGEQRAGEMTREIGRCNGRPPTSEPAPEMMASFIPVPRPSLVPPSPISISEMEQMGLETLNLREGGAAAQ